MRCAHQNHLPTFDMLKQNKERDLSCWTFFWMPHVDFLCQDLLEDSLFEGDQGAIRKIPFLKITAFVTQSLEKRSFQKI